MAVARPPGTVDAPSYLVETREAQTGADLLSIQRDLKLVRSGVEQLSRFGEDEAFDELRTALIDSVVIRYRRCFVTGLRAKLTRQDVLKAAPAYIEIHDFFYDLGSKHVAHSVSALEQSVAMVHVDESDPDAWKVVAQMLMHLEGSVETINLIRLGELSEILLREHVAPEQRRYEELFEKQVESFTHIRLRKLKPALLPVNLGHTEIGKRRWRPG